MSATGRYSVGRGAGVFRTCPEGRIQGMAAPVSMPERSGGSCFLA
ncbi:MAG: hypothetical protein OXD44_06855 [Gammaproteobacteria bacterium]|nr:hypothetical protein [Gammaproteobacteria bacterium]